MLVHILHMVRQKFGDVSLQGFTLQWLCLSVVWWHDYYAKAQL
jgi:hypothetical protein